MTNVLSGSPTPVAAAIANNNESENASIALEKPQERAVDVEESKEDKEKIETKQDEVYDIPVGEYCKDIWDSFTYQKPLLFMCHLFLSLTSFYREQSLRYN